MRISNTSVACRLLFMMLIGAVVTSCSVPASNSTATTAANQERGGQEEFGPYELVENWLQLQSSSGQIATWMKIFCRSYSIDMLTVKTT